MDTLRRSRVSTHLRMRHHLVQVSSIRSNIFLLLIMAMEVLVLGINIQRRRGITLLKTTTQSLPLLTGKLSLLLPQQRSAMHRTV